MNPAERPIKVLHVITRLIQGGAQYNTLLTAIGQNDDPRFEVTLLAGVDDSPEGNLHERAERAGVKLVLTSLLVRPIRPLTDVRALFFLWRFIRRNRFDVVHTHSSKAGIVGRIAAWLAGTPVIIHTLHSLVFHEFERPWKNRLYILLKKVCAPLTHVLISVNDRTRLGAIEAGIGRPEQHVRIFSGIKLEAFLTVGSRWSVEAAKHRLGIPADALVVGKIARLVPLKGHDLFLEAASRIAAAEPRAWFLLVGDGSLRGDLEKQAEQLGLRDRMVFAGMVPLEEMPPHIQAMDVVVHTSLREGIARAIPESGAVAKPVVTFDMDGAPEVVVDGETGYLVAPHDTTRLAERVVELLRDADRRRAFGERARAFVARHFDAPMMVAAINRIYLDELSRANPDWSIAGAMPSRER